MIYIVTCSMLLIGFVLILLSVNFTESEKGSLASDSAFECGFEPFFLPRVPFSIHFFTITIVFLIFDLEIVILLPILLKEMSSLIGMQLSYIIFILFLGLVVEWYDNSLEWQK